MRHVGLAFLTCLVTMVWGWTSGVVAQHRVSPGDEPRGVVVPCGPGCRLG